MTFKTDAERTYDDGLRDGQRDWSGNNSWTFSVHMADYCRGFKDGNRIRDARPAQSEEA